MFTEVTKDLFMAMFANDQKPKFSTACLEYLFEHLTNEAEEFGSEDCILDPQDVHQRFTEYDSCTKMFSALSLEDEYKAYCKAEKSEFEYSYGDPAKAFIENVLLDDDTVLAILPNGNYLVENIPSNLT